MKIAIVGPAHPYKGGIAQHTTDLAHELEHAGHQVDLVSWKSQYPGFLYPGEQFVPIDKSERPLFKNTQRVLNWYNPFGWWRWGRRFRDYDQVILTWWVPTIQGPVYLTMLRALGRKQHTKVTIISHNTLPHEGRPGDKPLTKAVFGRADKVVVHTPEQQKLVAGLVDTPQTQVSLPLALPGEPPKDRNTHHKIQHHLVFFGFVRPYKGVDVLLRAITQIPEVKLSVIGEFWDKAAYDGLIEELHVSDRVTLRKEYLPAEEMPAMFASADAIVLPYREGTGSYHIKIAQLYGLPVIATTAGPLKDQIRNGVDGLQCKPDDVDDLARAIREFYKPGVADKLRQGVPSISPREGWDEYIAAIEQ